MGMAGFLKPRLVVEGDDALVYSSARAFRNIVRMCFVNNGPFRFLHRVAFAHHWHHRITNNASFCIPFIGLGCYKSEDPSYTDFPCESVGHGEIATGSVESCKEFWRSFLRSSVVMDWVEHG